MPRAAALLVLAVIAALQLSAIQAGVSYTGTFSQDDDKREFFFTLSAPGTITLRTFSYAGGVNSGGATIPQGGFDPTISVFDSSGNLVASNRDGGCANVAADAVTAFCWDSWLQETLPAGNYTAVLTQSENLPNGPTLPDSFVYNGQGNFTAAPGNATPGFWDFFPSQRTGSYAIDIVGATASETTTITSLASLPQGITGEPYQFTFAAQSGPGVTLTWSVAAGSLLPVGLMLNSSTGILAGTPTAAGNYSFTVQVTDGVQPVAQTVSLTISSPLVITKTYSPISITNTSLPNGVVNQSYGPVAFGFTGGSGAANWSAGGLPAGLSMSSNGQLTGTPTVGGTFRVLISITDPVSSLLANVNLSLTINFAPLQITSSGSLGGFVPESRISNAPTATGGEMPYAWSASGLPAGFNLNASNGAFSGTAPPPGIYSFSLKVSDSQSPPASAIISVGFSVLGITTSTLTPGSTATVYSQAISAIGGTPPYSFSGSGIPAGLSLSSSGVLSGTPTTAGTVAFTARVSDSAGLATSSTISIVVTGATSPLAVPGGPLTDGSVSVPYTTTLPATGGSPPYSWSLVGGALPDGGFTLAGSGFIMGTPKTANTYTFTAQATDSAGTHISGTFTIKVDPAPMLLSSLSSFPVGVVGSEYPLQILSASGGTAPYTFGISGSLPSGLTFSSPQIGGVPTATGTFAFTVTLTDSSSPPEQVVANGSITINPAHADLIISQSAVSFSLTVGAAGVPTPASVTVRSSVIQQLLNFSAAANPAVSWLDLAGAGATPGSVGLTLDVSALSLGASTTPYRTTVDVTCIAPSLCAGNIQTIIVSLTVTAAAPQLTTSGLLSFFASTSNPAASSQALDIQNTGGGTLTINSVTAADSWLTFTGAPATIEAGPAVNLTVTANPAGLSAGYYLSSLTVNSSAGSVVVPVTLDLTQNPVMSLSPGGAEFDTPAGTAPGETDGSFNVDVSSASANWSASVLPGASWLSVSTPSGVATPAAPGAVSFAIDPTIAAGLPAQPYYGVIQVTSGDVVDSPLSFVVVLNVTPATTPVKPDPNTGGIAFTSGTGGSPISAPFARPAANVTADSTSGGTSTTEAIEIFASSTAPIAYQASAIASGSSSNSPAWLSVSPATGFASSSSPGQSVIVANSAGLAPGVYRGGVSYAFSSDAVRTVNITLVVPAMGPPSLAASGNADGLSTKVTAAACTPAKLVPTQVGLVDNFAQPAGWPTPLAINVLNDCGAPVPNAQVVATFSNGDPPLLLSATDASSGTFVGTWTPRSVSSQVTITGKASAPNFAPALVQITGLVAANSAPVLTPYGTVHVFDPGAGVALAPGSIVAIYGANLSGGVTPSSTVPLTTSLGGTSVLIGGIEAPLFYVSPLQVNAQVPFGLTPGNSYQILISANGAVSTPDSIQLSPVSPEIAIYPTTGQIIAQHAADYSMVTEDSPAIPGEYLIFYLAGMGPTDNPVATGAASPSNPLAHPVSLPTLTLNGNPVLIAFAGLTPTAVGLYQIDFQVPSGASSGDQPLVVSQSGVPTNTTILPVK